MRREGVWQIFFLTAALFLGASLVILCLNSKARLAAYLPGNFDLEPFLRYNNVYHLAGYFLLSLLLMLSMGRGSRYRVPAALLVPLALGGVIELLQTGVRDHMCSWSDFGLNALGSCAAVGACWLGERIQRGSR